MFFYAFALLFKIKYTPPPEILDEPDFSHYIRMTTLLKLDFATCNFALDILQFLDTSIYILVRWKPARTFGRQGIFGLDCDVCQVPQFPRHSILEYFI